jgi:hypothetical protein
MTDEEVEMRAMKLIALVTALLFLVGVPASAMVEGGVPIRGYMPGYATWQQGEVDPITGDPCQHYGGLATLGYGVGTVSHLGRARVETAHCTPQAEPYTGKMTLTAANGDRLVIHYTPVSEHIDPVAGEYEAVCMTEVIGAESTGRFAGADGDITMTVHLTFEDFDDPVWPGAFRIEGRIDY